MSKFDKIRAAVEGEELDEIAVSVWWHFPGRDLNARDLCEMQLEFQRRFDPDLMKVCPSGGYPSIAFGAEIEYYGSPTGAPRTKVPRIRSAEDWGALEELDVQDGVLGEMVRAVECIGRGLEGRVPFIQTVFSPLTICLKIGDGRLLGDLRSEPDGVEEALEVISRTMAEFARANMDAGASGLFFATQMATLDRLTEDEYRRFGVRYDLPVLRAVRSRAFINVVHIHGENIMFDLIAESYPADALNWHDQRTPPSLADASERFPGALLGGIDERNTLVKGTTDDVEAMVKDAVKDVSGRRLILAPGCVIPLAAPPSNLDAVIRTARSYKDWR
ncbi:uroporphyrinogen decarboxylase [Candidatus Bathyarchaeota archaeon]|nr:MAG: uroporphyrinogen decarboxylase [Candidatus Bathyarchaeota archaeon]